MKLTMQLVALGLALLPLTVTRGATYNYNLVEGPSGSTVMEIFALGDIGTGALTITPRDLDAPQLRLGGIFGKTIRLTHSGALQRIPATLRQVKTRFHREPFRPSRKRDESMVSACCWSRSGHRN
ncbi:MAG: hypothetical protein LBK71_08180 [Verrucomicrobiales bacterium]|jgi:hypothetical protein|nr:hypothetical protein [Verrucomicrobiales bacterium]